MDGKSRRDSVRRDSILFAMALRHSILRDARLLWSRAPELPADFWARTHKEYLDLKPYLERYDRDLFRQAATGTLR